MRQKLHKREKIVLEVKNEDRWKDAVDRVMQGRRGVDNCVSDREKERVANSVCAVGIDQSHRLKGVTRHRDLTLRLIEN